MNSQLGLSDEELARQAGRIDLAHQSDFALGPVTVQPSLRKIGGPLGEAIVEPKVMQVLVTLAEPIGTIFSRDDLIERCWEGRVVGDSSINRVISLLRSGLKEAAGEAVALENVPKVGYRILINASEEQSAPASEMTEVKPKARPRMLAAAALALLALIGAVFWWQQSSNAPVNSVRVALLPLEFSEGVDPIYAAGLESELRTQFARIEAIEATTSESAEILAEEGLELDEIGKRLRVDYVWSGRLVLEADRVTIAGKLISVESGEQVWQDSIASTPDAAQYIPLRTARSLASSLGLPVSEQLPQASVDAAGYRLYLSAMGLLKGRGVEQRGAALAILKEVTADNPDFADGWAGLAKAHYIAAEPNPNLEGGNWGEAQRIAQRALALDPVSVDALKVAGRLAKDPEKGLAMLQQAVKLDPGDAEAWFWLSIQQQQNLLLGQNPLESVQRMVQIDPLWPATWRASDIAAEFGRLKQAREMEAEILAAAVTSSQRDLANARLARIDGDLSTFLELSRRASNTQTGAERRYGSSVQIDIAKHLLGLPSDQPSSVGRRGPPDLMIPILRGELPSLKEFEAAGFGGANFWNSPDVAQFAMPLFLKTGREAELVALFDARFPSHNDYLDFAEMIGVPQEIIPSASPYLALAMQKVGRDDDAAAHIESAEEQVLRWREADSGSMMAVIYELQLVAAKSDKSRATALVRQLPEFGWPYTIAHAHPTMLSLLGENVLFDDVKKLPEVQAVLDPIRANLAREREQALSLGFN